MYVPAGMHARALGVLKGAAVERVPCTRCTMPLSSALDSNRTCSCLESRGDLTVEYVQRGVIGQEEGSGLAKDAQDERVNHGQKHLQEVHADLIQWQHTTT